MVAPALLFSEKSSIVEIIGGTDVKWSPPSLHLYALCSHFLSRMNVKIQYNVIKPGFFPKGQGISQIKIDPIPKGKFIKPINLVGEKGKVEMVYVNVITRNDDENQTFGNKIRDYVKKKLKRYFRKGVADFSDYDEVFKK